MADILEQLRDEFAGKKRFTRLLKHIQVDGKPLEVEIERMTWDARRKAIQKHDDPNLGLIEKIPTQVFHTGGDGPVFPDTQETITYLRGAVAPEVVRELLDAMLSEDADFATAKN